MDFDLGANGLAMTNRTRHSEHWPQDLLQKGFKRMELFRSFLRVNAGDKTQAYASLPGLSADIFIRVRSDTCRCTVEASSNYPYWSPSKSSTWPL